MNDPNTLQLIDETFGAGGAIKAIAVRQVIDRYEMSGLRHRGIELTAEQVQKIRVAAQEVVSATNSLRDLITQVREDVTG